jgi:thiamine transport system ATP-binding protein
MSLHVESICVEIDGVTILDSVSLDVPTGSTVAVVGPSGVGKSTLLRVIAGIIEPTSGSISIDGVDISSLPVHERTVAMVFQNDQLFPHLDVSHNIAFGLDVTRPLMMRLVSSRRVRREWSKERKDRVTEMLDLVGLSGFEDRDTGSLSGGEAKRVALARALAPAPSVLLLDEPLTGLDRELHDRLMHDLGRILEKTGTTTVLVTHDVAEAKYLADRVEQLRACVHDPVPESP